MAWFRGKRRRRFGVERLEEKRPMAGDVAVMFSGGTLEIQGDDLDNAISVVQAPNGTLTIRGVADANGVATTVNGRASVSFASASIQNAQIKMAGGNDTVVVRDLRSANDISIETEAGDDRVTMSGATAGASLLVKTGVGADRVVLTSVATPNDLVVETEDGADTVSLRTSNIGKSVNLLTGQGNDVVTVALGSGSE